jgi:NADPH:quinone reductase-like Zn-dependent oxidoreductase
MEYASETRDQITLLAEMLEKNRLQPVIDKVYPLEEIREAHRYVETGRKKGNVVIRMAHG